jgi:translation initiation factor IF-3
MFRGREVQHPDLGERLLRRLATDLDDLGRIESQPNLDGRNMVMVMAPKKESKEAQQDENVQQDGRRERAARR